MDCLMIVIKETMTKRSVSANDWQISTAVFVSDIAIFVLKRDVKLQLTPQL